MANIKLLVWNIEGIKSAISLIPKNLFENYDIIILTETFLVTDWNINGFYCIHTHADQGPLGRPKGGIMCMLKSKFSPFGIIHKTKSMLIVKTEDCIFVCLFSAIL